MTKRAISSLCSRCTSLRANNLVFKSWRPNREPSGRPAPVAHRAYSSDAPKLNYTLLSGRALISLDGPDATDFLHNLIPAPVLPLDETSSCIATAFLNAKGRIIHDAFIYKPSKDKPEQWIVEVDANSASALFRHLKKHKLRSRFKLQQLSTDEAQVLYLWPRSAMPDGVNVTAYQDPRPKMGTRALIIGQGADASLKSMLEAQVAKEEYHWEDYMIHRILNGHAEGPVEIPPEHALPQESNLDFYRGIDFQKGCYLGQELTIRTHHTGIVRKRILPVQIYSDGKPIPPDQTRPLYEPLAALPQPPNEANIAKCGAKGRSGRSTGKWLRGYGNIGLALCRLETMTDLSLTTEGSQYKPATDEFEVSWRDELADADKTVKVKAFVPPWLRQSIDQSIKARSDRSARRKQRSEEDEDDVD